MAAKVKQIKCTQGVFLKTQSVPRRDRREKTMIFKKEVDNFGEWLPADDGWFSYYRCSNCGYKTMNVSNECPACKATMEKSHKNNKTRKEV